MREMIKYTPTEEKLFDRIEKALERKGQVILYGPPGTGKTYSAKRYIDWKKDKNTGVVCLIHRAGSYQSVKLFVNEEGISVTTIGRAMSLHVNTLFFVCDFVDGNIICNGIAKIVDLERAENDSEKTSFEYSAILGLEKPIDITSIFNQEVQTEMEQLEESFASRRYVLDETQVEKMIEMLRDHKEIEAESLMRTVEMCTFHPSYTYEDFIEGYKPSTVDNTVSFTLQDGLFKRFCSGIHFNFPYYFIIDEINRGNVPKVFGELITLLEKDKRGSEVILPYSKQPFSIPQGLNIIGTMNTSDRSIKMMDAAFKRRFSFIEVMPDPSLINKKVTDLNLSPGEILQQLNERLIERFGRDKQIGHSYFMQDGQQVETVAEIRDIFEMDIIPLVQEYCHSDYNVMAEIIGANFVSSKWEINRSIFEGEIDLIIQAIKSHFRSTK